MTAVRILTICVYALPSLFVPELLANSLQQRANAQEPYSSALTSYAVPAPSMPQYSTPVAHTPIAQPVFVQQSCPNQCFCPSSASPKFHACLPHSAPATCLQQPTLPWNPCAPLVQPTAIPRMAYQPTCGYTTRCVDKSRGLFGGVKLAWLRPTFDKNVAMIVDPPIGNTQTSFDNTFHLAPRAWLGWQDDSGNGFRASYFRFEHEAPTEAFTAVAGFTPVYLNIYGAGGNLTRNANANVGQTLVSDHSVMLQTLDFEATQPINWRTCTGICGVGVRVAEINQDLLANVYNPDNSLEEAVGNNLRVTGAGPTVSALLANRLGGHPFGGYIAGRSSLIIANSEQSIYEMKGAYTTELVDISNQRRMLGNFELGLGLQFARCVGRATSHAARPPVLFARAGYEAQLWLDVGGPIDADGALGLDGVSFALGVDR